MVRGLFLEFELAGRGLEQRDHRFLCDTLVDDTRHFGGAWLVAPEHAGKNDYEPVDFTDDRAAHHFRGRHVLLLLSHRPSGHASWRYLGPCGVGYPLRRHYRDSNAGWFR